MENFRLPLALVVAMIVQISGGVWWVSRLAATVEDLDEDVSQMSSRMAIEQKVNLRRDAERKAEEIKKLWESVETLDGIVTRQIQMAGRMTLLEREIEVLSRGRFRHTDQSVLEYQ